MNAIRYRPEIDGLRAVAVIPVILFHMGYEFISGGYIGVDVFFVISGFLITSIVREELASDTMSFKRFWARRIKRILPAMIVVTASVIAVSYLFVFKGDRPVIGKQAVAALLSVSNVYTWHTTGNYWGRKAEQLPFLHTWSLSVEEQFYILFPVAIWVVYRAGAHFLRNSIIFVLVSSLCLFLWGCVEYQTATFYMLPTRAWELATGCYVAFAFADRRGDSALSIAGLCMILSSYLFVPNLNGSLAIAVLGAALVIAFSGEGICNKVLSLSPLVQVGKLSYSLYLWHWPVLVFGKYFGFEAYKLVLAAIVVVLSVASYAFVEKPTRRREGIVPFIAVSYLVTLGFAWSLAFSSALYDTSKYAGVVWHGIYYDLMPHDDLNAEFRSVIASATAPERQAPADSYKNGGIIIGDGTPQVVVLGDSHGVMWSDAIRKVLPSGIAASFWSMNGVPPFVQLPLDPYAQQTRNLVREEKRQYDQARLECIKRWKPQVVVLCSRWATVEENDADDLLGFLQEHAAHVLLVEQPPELEIGNRNALQYICYLGMEAEDGVQKYLPQGNAEKCQEGRRLVQQLAEKYSKCQVIPTYDIYAKDAKVLVLDGKNTVYLDDDHLTEYGARLASARFEQKLTEILREMGQKR